MVLLKCFYCFFLLYSLVHLHSTMVLLKFSIYACFNMFFTSTFHYGSIKILNLEYSYDTLLHLHSTMVLLKFFLFIAALVGSFASTFHYGSIKIVYSPNKLVGASSSTFHYGSIKIIT